LLLRPFAVADAENLVSLDADPDVMRFVNGGTPTSRDEIEVLPGVGRLLRAVRGQIDAVEYALDKADWQQDQHGPQSGYMDSDTHSHNPTARRIQRTAGCATRRKPRLVLPTA
jgi:hypothetical protein